VKVKETMDSEQPAFSTLGFVTIGRNEGDRLKATFNAIQTLCPGAPVVYVDSGSNDDSVAFAKSLAIEVVELDLSIPFTAARARNAGFKQLMSLAPKLEYIQFLDGDCAMVEGWVEAALEALQTDSTAIVSGRRRERHPEISVYNALMDIEWNTPVGETLAVPGDMCVKTAVFKQVNGFDESIIAAEDDDLCIRVRRAGYKIFRLDTEMSLHDANILKLSQWYKRIKRGGHAYANIYAIHGHGPERYFRKQLLSASAWGGVVPALFLSTLLLIPALALVIATAYSAFIARTVLRRLRMGDSVKIAFCYGVLIYTGKIAEVLGAIQYWKNRALSRKHLLIEYK
jgi:GT2 family glycosyltransferase